jgi:hypothetical protein
LPSANHRRIVEGMGRNRTELGTLKRLLTQIGMILSSATFPDNPRCRELLGAAVTLTDDLLKQDKLPAAQMMGSKGGSVTAQRGSEYFRQLAAKRKTNAGGRPRKQAD